MLGCLRQTKRVELSKSFARLPLSKLNQSRIDSAEILMFNVDSLSISNDVVKQAYIAFLSGVENVYFAF